MRHVASVFGRIWALPNSLLALLACAVALPWGVHPRVVSGVLEVHGAGIARLLRLVPVGAGPIALTLGHVVLGVNAAALDVTREHERVHVRQYELWGPFFLPAYGIASLIALVRGRHPYRDNCFEAQAYSIAGRPRPFQ